MKERNSVNERFKDVLNQLEEKERNFASEKSRLESRIDVHEKDLALCRKQVSDLTSEKLGMAARRETELREYQSKIERLSSGHEKLKGELLLSQNKESNALEKVHDLTTRLASKT